MPVVELHDPELTRIEMNTLLNSGCYCTISASSDHSGVERQLISRFRKCKISSVLLITNDPDLPDDLQYLVIVDNSGITVVIHRYIAEFLDNRASKRRAIIELSSIISEYIHDKYMNEFKCKDN